MRLGTSGSVDGAAGVGLPALGVGVPTIEAGPAGSSVSARARTRPFLAEGARASASGIESRPGCLIRFGPSTRARIECADMGAVAAVHLFPGLVRRELPGPADVIHEALMVAPTLPLVIGQWSSGAGSACGPLTVRIAPPPGRAGGWTMLQRDDAVVLLGSAEERFAVGCSPASVSIRVDADGSGAIRITCEPTGSGEDVSLILSAGREPEVYGAFSAVRHLRGHAIRAASAPEGALHVRTTMTEIDDAVAWLGARIAGQCRELDTGAEGAVLTAGLAAIAAGRRDAIHDVLSRRLVDSGRVGDSPAVYALLAARFASTFGDASHAVLAARRLVEATAEPSHPGPHRESRRADVPALARVAARHVAEALHHSAHPDTIATLQRLAAHPPGTGPAPSATQARGERPLPMLEPRRGGPPEAAVREPFAEDAVRWIEGLLKGDPETPPPHAGRTGVRTARDACAAFRINPDSAWAAWRALLAGGPPDDHPTTIWDPIMLSSDETDTERVHTSEIDAGSPGESLTAELILCLAEGLLGIVPDAPTGRIRIAPRLPSHLESFGVGGIRVGDATLGVSYERVASRHRFELEPDTASVPPLAVFEPAVPGSIRTVWIDDAPAALDSHPEGIRSIVSVQLPLDGTRRIEIETGPGPA